MAIAWAVAVASCVLGADLRLEAGAVAEGRTRTIDTEGAGRVTAVEASLRPRVSLGLVDPGGELRARYAPVLRAPDLVRSARPDVMHVAELHALLRLSPVWSARASAAAERGTTDLLAESRLHPIAVPEAVPTTAQLRFASVRGDLTVDGALDPRTRLSAGAGASAGGGDDAESRAVLPIERSVRGNARLEWDATRRDVLELRLAALGERLSTGRRALLATGLGLWRHRLVPEVQVRAGAGAAAIRQDAPGEPLRQGALPVDELGVAHASERLHLVEDAAVRLGAAVDRVRGTVDRALEGELAVRWTPDPALQLAVRATATIVRQENGDARRGATEVRADWRASPRIVLGLGLYGAWQGAIPAPAGPPPGPALPRFVEAGVLASVAMELPAWQ